MIIYHQANDIHHCVFRLLSLLSDIKENMTEYDRIRILDFYYLFPHLLADLKIPRNKIANKQILKKISQPYESLPNPQRLMFQLKVLQNEAVRALVAKGLIDKKLYLKNIIKLYRSKVPDTLLLKIEENEKRNKRWYKLLVQVFAHYPLNGNNGLKERTQLMEYRYDTD